MPLPADAVFHHGDGRRSVHKVRRPSDDVHRSFARYLPTRGFQIDRDQAQGDHGFVLDVTSGTRHFTLSIVADDANTTQLEVIPQ